MPDSTNYNAVVKGIPLGANFIPVPYYMPDDFVLIQEEVSPPATVFRTGDTVTVASGEVYTIINCDNQTNLLDLRVRDQNANSIT